MISSKDDLLQFLELDSRNYIFQKGTVIDRVRKLSFSNPVCDERYIWLYIKSLRHVEYLINSAPPKKYKKYLKTFRLLYWLRKLRKYSYITGFLIPPNVCGKGLTIWHWGSIIINPAAKIGDNCTLYPGVLIGQKYRGGGAAVIGNNVFIGAGTKIIGNITIGNNVTIGQNCVITKDIPDNSVVVCNNENRFIS